MGVVSRQAIPPIRAANAELRFYSSATSVQTTTNPSGQLAIETEKRASLSSFSHPHTPLLTISS
jgi:hypothetical protein